MFEIKSVCKGGGYMYARTIPLHPKANSKGLYPLHRVKMENIVGRLLLDNEVVHHKDEDKFNNNDSNLKIMTVSDHAALHAKRVDSIITSCTYCGNEISLKPSIYRRRTKRSKAGISCSRNCSVKLYSV